MRRHIDAHRVANQIRMLRSRSRNAFLIVEGETDCEFFRMLVAQGSCDIVVARSKADALRVRNELEQTHTMGYLVVVDADYWLADGCVPSLANLVVTDGHDLDTLLFMSPALDKLIAHCLPSSLSCQIDALVSRVREAVLQICLPIGYLRWAHERYSIGLSFKDLSYDRFISRSWTVDISKLLQACRQAGCAPNRSDAEIRCLCEELRKLCTDPCFVCQGHDLMNVLHQFLTSRIEALAGPDVVDKATRRFRNADMAAELRLAYEKAYFSGTRLAEAIRSWEAANAPFVVLA